jgi:shikimate dehydrogenase
MADPKAFVVGHPIAHSRSPLLHNHWLREFALPGSYERMDIAPSEFSSFLSGLEDNGFVGGNVTIPHKEAAFAAVGRRDAAAEAIGAVNTLWLENGLLCGGNTDAYGFAAHLDETVPGWDGARRAVVLGAGGAARAILFALLDRKIPGVTLVNRTRDRAQELAVRFGKPVTAAGWEDLPAHLEGADLLVNTTALGMAGKPPLEIDLAPLAANAVVSDIVYVPLKTPLLAAAARRGLRTADGLGMLLHQAVPGFERWFGRRPTVSAALRQEIERDIEAGS